MSILKLTRVTKVFGDGTGQSRPLDDIDFELMPREVVAIMGPSGSGKTTLLTIAGALQKPTSGVVEVDDQQIQALSQTELAAVRRHKIGFIFQSFNLLDALSAQENVEYAAHLSGFRGKHARERARSLLDMVDLLRRAEELPKRLSGGERQRVAIARAFANDGNVILADEPTASLDQERAQETMNILKSITHDLGRGIMIVTHDLRAQSHADRTFWLEGGKLNQIEAADPHLHPSGLLPLQS